MSGALVPKRIAAMYGSEACTRSGSCASSGVSAAPCRSRTTRFGSLSKATLVRDRNRLPRGRRACTPAPATSAPTRCARRSPTPRKEQAACAAGRSNHRQTCRRSSDIVTMPSGGRRARSLRPGIAHLLPCRRRARAAGPAPPDRPDTQASTRDPAPAADRRPARAIRSCRPSRCGSNRRVPPFPIRLDRRTDKNQSDKSICSKADNVQPARSWGS